MRLFIFVLSLTFCAPGSAAIYRCETPIGVRFQEKPCDGIPSTEVEIRDYKIGSRAVPQVDLTPSKGNTKKRGKSRSAKKSNDKACFSKRQQLEKLQWRMRRGYRAGQGPKLRQRRRALDDYIREFCT